MDTKDTENEVDALLNQLESGMVAQEDSMDRLEKLITQLEKKLPAQSNADEQETDLRLRLAKMKLSEKVKLAMFGNALCRSLLILDTNKMINHFVLRNPKLTLKEVEEFSRNPNVAQHVLRAVADRKEWMKHYPLKLILVTNPKTPQDVALKWLRYLNAPELKDIARSKNVPQIISVTAKKRLNDIAKR